MAGSTVFLLGFGVVLGSDRKDSAVGLCVGYSGVYLRQFKFLFTETQEPLGHTCSIAGLRLYFARFLFQFHFNVSKFEKVAK